MLTQELVKSLFSYDADTGVLTWLSRGIRKWDVQYAGKRAGAVCLSHAGKTYRQIYILNKNYKEHRVIWLYMTGNLPDDQIDHIDGNGANNKWCNLRSVDNFENKKNVKKYSNNTSGISGVVWDKNRNKWLVRVGSKFIGYCTSLEDAEVLRETALSDAGYHPNHGSNRQL